MEIALLVLRVVVGLLLVGHGAQKLFGWFGGHGLAGTAAWLGSLELRPGKFWASLAGAAEFFGGLLMVLGLFNPLGSLAVIGAMVSAAVLVHIRSGLWATNGGYELPLVLATGAAAVVLAGPGTYSVDALLGLDVPGAVTAVAALGIACATLYLAYNRRAAAQAATAATEA